MRVLLSLLALVALWDLQRGLGAEHPALDGVVEHRTVYSIARQHLHPRRLHGDLQHVPVPGHLDHQSERERGAEVHEGRGCRAEPAEAGPFVGGEGHVPGAAAADARQLEKGRDQAHVGLEHDLAGLDPGIQPVGDGGGHEEAFAEGAPLSPLRTSTV